MNKRPKITRLDDLPDTLTAQHIADFEGISRTTVYTLLDLSPECGGIPSYGIMRNRRVDKADFIAWREGRKQIAAQRFKEGA